MSLTAEVIKTLLEDYCQKRDIPVPSSQSEIEGVFKRMRTIGYADVGDFEIYIENYINEKDKRKS